MTRGLHLTLAALGVAGFSVSAFAFTPAVGPIPDIIIGDRTPTGLAGSDDPDDPFTHGDSLEDSLGEAANTYRFVDAINIFTLAEDSGRGLTGYTSDQNLIYAFFATNVGGSTTSRLSINGTPISSNPINGFTTVPVTGANSSLDFENTVADAASDFTNGEIQYYWVGDNGGEASRELINTATDTSFAGPVELIDQQTVTVRVTNTTGQSASDIFFVYTVDNGPDAISGLVLSAPERQDLSEWAYNGSANQQSALGSLYPGDTQATGTEIPDNDSDASVSDLVLNAGAVGGDFFHAFARPNSIPFVNDGTYHLTWNVSTNIATASAIPDLRLRWGYNSSASLGGGDVVANAPVAPPDANGRDYQMMFDQLDVSAHSAVSVFTPGQPENSIALFFESLDFDQAGATPPGSGSGSIGGGAVELNSVEISLIDRGALAAIAQTEVNVTNFSTQMVPIGFTNTAAGQDTTVTPTATNVTMTAVGPIDPGPGTLYGDPYALTDRGMGIPAIARTAGAARAYRFTTTVNAGTNGTAAAYLPRYNMQVSTTVSGIPRYTGEQEVKSRTLQATINQGYVGVKQYAAYMILPEGADFGPSSPIGDGVTANFRLQDDGDEQVGTLTVTQATLSSFPEALLP